MEDSQRAIEASAGADGDGRRKFPFEKRLCRFGFPAGCSESWHWRDEIELCRVRKGKIRCAAGGKSLLLCEGQHLFVNAGALRMYAAEPGSGTAEMETVLFRPDFIADEASAMYKTCVRPLLDCRALSAFSFDEPLPWQAEARALFDRLCALDEDSCFGYELLCRNLLSGIWLLFADHMRGVYQGANAPESQLVNEQRAKRMLSFIREHYGEDITIDAIAASASISRSECFRCFRRAIGKKPVEYLTEYRVERAAGLLSGSDLPVTEICYRCGFASPSYFGKVFRSATGLSPRAFRNEAGQRRADLT